jgi:hypothetical protein
MLFQEALLDFLSKTLHFPLRPFYWRYYFSPSFILWHHKIMGLGAPAIVDVLRHQATMLIFF